MRSVSEDDTLNLIGLSLIPHCQPPPEHHHDRRIVQIFFNKRFSPSPHHSEIILDIFKVAAASYFMSLCCHDTLSRLLMLICWIVVRHPTCPGSGIISVTSPGRGG